MSEIAKVIIEMKSLIASCSEDDEIKEAKRIFWAHARQACDGGVKEFRSTFPNWCKAIAALPDTALFSQVNNNNNSSSGKGDKRTMRENIDIENRMEPRKPKYSLLTRWVVAGMILTFLCWILYLSAAVSNPEAATHFAELDMRMYDTVPWWSILLMIVWALPMAWVLPGVYRKGRRSLAWLMGAMWMAVAVFIEVPKLLGPDAILPSMMLASFLFAPMFRLARTMDMEEDDIRAEKKRQAGGACSVDASAALC